MVKFCLVVLVCDLKLNGVINGFLEFNVVVIVKVGFRYLSIVVISRNFLRWMFMGSLESSCFKGVIFLFGVSVLILIREVIVCWMLIDEGGLSVCNKIDLIVLLRGILRILIWRVRFWRESLSILGIGCLGSYNE